MMDGIDIHSDRVRLRGPDICAAGDGVGRGRERLAATLAGLDGMIGGDKYGDQFRKGYDPAHRDIDQAARHGVEVLRGMGGAVCSMADSYQDMDSDNAKMLRPKH